MYFIVGLGNPGKKYERTRHNVGFMVLDEMEKKNLSSHVCLLKPKTFMNNSGVAVKKEIRNLKLKIKKLIVVHDDIDISLGKIKVSVGRGSAGHKGVESIIKALGTKNFTRIRIGIQPSTGKPRDVEHFVLKNFTSKELMLLKNSIQKSLDALMKCIPA